MSNEDQAAIRVSVPDETFHRLAERMAVAETTLMNTCRDIDGLFDLQRKLEGKLDHVVVKVTEMDEHLKNGLGMRIIKGIDEYLEKKRAKNDRMLRWLLGAFALVEAVSLVITQWGNGG